MYDVAQDGRFLVVTVPDAGKDKGPPRQIILNQNWFEELKERVPVDYGYPFLSRKSVQEWLLFPGTAYPPKCPREFVKWTWQHSVNCLSDSSQAFLDKFILTIEAYCLQCRYV